MDKEKIRKEEKAWFNEWGESTLSEYGWLKIHFFEAIHLQVNIIDEEFNKINAEKIRCLKELINDEKPKFIITDEKIEKMKCFLKMGDYFRETKNETNTKYERKE